MLTISARLRYPAVSVKNQVSEFCSVRSTSFGMYDVPSGVPAVFWGVLGTTRPPKVGQSARAIVQRGGHHAPRHSAGGALGVGGSERSKVGQIDVYLFIFYVDVIVPSGK